MLRSDDLREWSAVGYALVEPEELRGCAYWAPEVAERDGTFYLYYSAGGAEGEDHRIRVARASRPEGPFQDLGAPVVPGEPFSIDAHPFRDPRSGGWYLFFVKDFFDGRVGSGIAAAPLADDMRRLAGPIHTVYRAAADWHLFARDREWYGRVWDAWHTVEGPSVVYRDGRYWLFYSGGLWKGPDYGVGVAVADDGARTVRGRRARARTEGAARHRRSSRARPQLDRHGAGRDDRLHRLPRVGSAARRTAHVHRPPHVDAARPARRVIMALPAFPTGVLAMVD